jgi:hypothetical protein
MQHLPEMGFSRSILSERRDIEAANVIVRQRHHPNWRNKYVVHLYERTKRRKGHSVAVGATARYLAEVTYWVLVSLSQGQVRA